LYEKSFVGVTLPADRRRSMKAEFKTATKKMLLLAFIPFIKTNNKEKLCTDLCTSNIDRKISKN
jgi:hypothetical protein